MKEFIEDFRQAIEKSAAAMRHIPEDASAIPRTPGTWSRKQIMGHLLDSACNNHRRFVLAQIQGDLVFPGYDQRMWVELQRYQDAPWSSLIEFWRAYNLHLAHVMAAIPVDLLRRPYTKHTLHQIASEPIPEKEPATLEYLIRDYVGHLKHHVDQILGA